MEVPTLNNWKLYDIASLIRKDWKNPHFGAAPYIDALGALTTIENFYGHDPGSEIVARFLGNASAWRGPVAKAVKAELQRRYKAVK